MTRRRENTATSPAAEASPGAVPLHAWVERFALLVLLALIPLRTVVAETHTFEVARLLRNLNAPIGAQPATTLLIVGVIAGVAAMVGFVRLFWGGCRYRWTGAELGAALLLAAGIISTVHAGQKHLALTGTLDFLGTVLYLLTLRQLLVRPWHVRLTLTVVLATGAMVITKCAWQHWVELPQTIRYYEAHKAELTGDSHRLHTDATEQQTSASGSKAAANSARTNTLQKPVRYQPSGLQYDYEKRLLAGTATGYYGHPNILGSHLILFIMAGIAVIECRIRRRRPLWTVGLPILIVITGGIAMIGTQSKGAMAACAIGVLLWLIGSRLGKRPSARPRLLLIGLWIGAASATVVFISVLRVHPQIAGRSILFRYMYWQGARDMIAEKGLMGVGADNFGRHFTRYKPVACPEEVQSPHSWVVQLVAEWGVLGLIGFLALLVGVSLRLVPARKHGLTDPSASHRLETVATVQAAPVAGDTAKSPTPRKPPAADRTATLADGPGSVVLWMAGLGGIFLVWWLDVMGEADVGFIAITILIAAAPWVLGFVFLAIENLESTLFADDRLGPLLPALCAGLIAFLLHTGIDLALFAGGPATTFFALMAVVLACGRLGGEEVSQEPARTSQPGGSHRLETGASKRPAAARRRRNRRKTTGVILAVGSLVVLGAYGLGAVRPAARLARYLEVARTSDAPPNWATYVESAGSLAYRDAADCDHLDGTALVEWIETLIPRVRTVEHVATTMELVGKLQRRDPFNAISDNDLCVLYRQRFELAHDRADLTRSIDAYRRYVADYPTSPDRRIYLANLLENDAAQTRDAAVRAEAARQLQTALDLDAQRIYVSKPNRLQPEQIKRIRERIARLTRR